MFSVPISRVPASSLSLKPRFTNNKPILYLYPLLKSTSLHVPSVIVQVLVSISKFEHETVYTTEHDISPSKELPMLVLPDMTILSGNEIVDWILKTVRSLFDGGILIC